MLLWLNRTFTLGIVLRIVTLELLNLWQVNITVIISVGVIYCSSSSELTELASGIRHCTIVSALYKV